MQRSCLRVLLCLLLALFWSAASAAAPLAANTDHTGEDHSRDTVVGANLANIILDSADLQQTTLTGSVLTNASLVNANLDKAKLDGVDFTGADLTGAILTKAHIDGAIFSGADLRGANLSQVKNAITADFTGAFYDATTILDPSIDTSGMVVVAEPSTWMLLAGGALLLWRRAPSLA